MLSRAYAEALEAMPADYWGVGDTEVQPIDPAVLVASDVAP